MSEDVVPVFHHGGSFVRDNKGVLVYINGKVERFPPMDVDLICFFDLKKLFLDLGYHDYKAMYWYDPTSETLESGLHPIHGDKEIRALQKNKIQNEDTDEFYIYFDHPVLEGVEEILSDSDEGAAGVVVEDAGLDNDADIESSSSDDDGYESTEDEPYKPPPSGYDFFESSEDEECSNKNSGTKGRKCDKEKKKTTMKASKPNVNVTRGSKAKTQGKKAGYKKDDCAVSGGNGPEVRKKGDGGSRAVGPDSVEPSPADNNGPNEVNGNDPRKPSTFTEEIGVEPRDESDIDFEYESEAFLTPPDSSDDGGEGFNWPQYDPNADFGEVQFQLRMEFKTLDQFKKALKDYTIAEGRRIFYIKNDKGRVRAACVHGGFMAGKEIQKDKAKARLRAKREAKAKDGGSNGGEEENAIDNIPAVANSTEANPDQNGSNPGSEAVGDKEQKASKPGSEAVGDKEQNASKPGSEAVSDKAQHEKNECPWIIYCARNSRSGGYQIKTFNHVHTCGREFGSNMADQNWVAEKLAKRLLSQPRLTHAEAWDHIKIDYNVIISDKMLYRGLKIAREKYVGNEKAQYGKLRDYLQELHRTNHGSTALLAVEPIPQSPPLFDKLYVCLDACKKGFRAGCRPLIGLDGCFLKGYYGGQLLSAVAQDANNHFYVIAYAVVASETKES
ncbi:uncharacterized protein [Arachis hypogaea]|uniref:uncharacterized protein n=1 Tax=Arachis hypogaea TaxID=3818 RepID=UPI000DEC1774|nr:uncharacterized protein LOC112714560 [Arachis hypogaea]